jgi:hypothetical protein
MVWVAFAVMSVFFMASRTARDLFFPRHAAQIRRVDQKS